MQDPLAVVTRLSGQLAGWLPGQRWYAAKGREVSTVTPVAATMLYLTEDGTGPARLDHTLVEVSYADGSSPQRYQVLVGYRPQLPERLEHVRIAEVTLDGVPHVAYDAVWDTELAVALLRLIAAGEPRGELRFATEDATAIPLRAAEVTTRVVDTEQSNTSVIYDEAAILKLFRRVVPGVNPDLELARALHRVGCAHVPPLLGSVTGQMRGESAAPTADAAWPVSYAMLSEYAVNSADGWAMATTSVRDLMAEQDLRADEVGGDFAAESHRLGEAVATVHADLARALGTSHLDSDGLATLAGRLEARLAAAIDAVPDLEPYESALQEAYRAVTTVVAPVPLQRIHGDLHLGQVLRTPGNWLLIDFEGEPITPLAERVRPDTTLRDVAGMLRSYDYAAAHLLLSEEREAPLGLTEEQDSQLRFRTEEWIARNRDAFCRGYTAVAGADPRDEPVLLHAYELDKAVYETVYESRNRPTWLPIPLSSIARLVQH